MYLRRASRNLNTKVAQGAADTSMVKVLGWGVKLFGLKFAHLIYVIWDDAAGRKNTLPCVPQNIKCQNTEALMLGVIEIDNGSASNSHRHYRAKAWLQLESQLELLLKFMRSNRIWNGVLRGPGLCHRNRDLVRVLPGPAWQKPCHVNPITPWQSFV